MESTLTRNGSKTVDENKLDHQHELVDSCRVCMGWALEMEPLFEAENRSILDKIEYCTGLLLKQEDGFPSFICEMCIKSVKEAHSFKTTCLNSDEVFRKLRLVEVKEEVKQEVDDDDEPVTYENVQYDDDDENYDEIQVKESESESSSAYKLRSSQKHDIIPRDSHTVDSLNETLKSPNISFSDSDSSQHSSNNQRKITSPSKRLLKSDYKSDLELFLTRKCRKKKKAGAKKKSKEKKNIYKCESCSLEFVYRAEYVKHRKVVHDDCHPESAICELCGRFFHKRSAYYQHMIAHRPHSFECAKCGYKTNWKPSLIKHLRNHDGMLYSCSIFQLCGRFFHNRSTFHSHKIAHRPQSFECAICGYKTNWKQDLIKHLRIHDDVNLYQCEFCSKTLRTTSSLRSHIKKIHENLRPHKCTMCDKSFYERTKLSRHIDSHNSVKRFTCEYCHSSFTRRSHWKKHLEKNHGVVMPRAKPGRRSLYEVMQDYQR